MVHICFVPGNDLRNGNTREQLRYLNSRLRIIVPDLEVARHGNDFALIDGTYRIQMDDRVLEHPVKENLKKAGFQYLKTIEIHSEQKRPQPTRRGRYHLAHAASA